MLWLSAAIAADVKIGVNIGVPAPVVVAPAPAVVVAPPGPPSSSRRRRSRRRRHSWSCPEPRLLRPECELPMSSVFGGRCYGLHEGAWFMAPNHSGPGPWFHGTGGSRFTAVPHAYYKVPPGQAKKMSAQDVPPGHAKGRGGKKGGDDWRALRGDHVSQQGLSLQPRRSLTACVIRAPGLVSNQRLPD
jgi:hypothetical protein